MLPAARRALSPKSEKWARGDGEAVLGEIQGQSTHVSTISHLRGNALPPGYNHTQQDVRFGYIVLPASDAVFLFMSMAACI